MPPKRRRSRRQPSPDEGGSRVTRHQIARAESGRHARYRGFLAQPKFYVMALSVVLEQAGYNRGSALPGMLIKVIRKQFFDDFWTYDILTENFSPLTDDAIYDEIRTQNLIPERFQGRGSGRSSEEEQLVDYVNRVNKLIIESVTSRGCKINNPNYVGETVNLEESVMGFFAGDPDIRIAGKLADKLRPELIILAGRQEGSSLLKSNIAATTCRLNFNNRKVIDAFNAPLRITNPDGGKDDIAQYLKYQFVDVFLFRKRDVDVSVPNAVTDIIDPLMRSGKNYIFLDIICRSANYRVSAKLSRLIIAHLITVMMTSKAPDKGGIQGIFSIGLTDEGRDMLEDASFKPFERKFNTTRRVVWGTRENRRTGRTEESPAVAYYLGREDVNLPNFTRYLDGVGNSDTGEFFTEILKTCYTESFGGNNPAIKQARGMRMRGCPYLPAQNLPDTYPTGAHVPRGREELSTSQCKLTEGADLRERLLEAKVPGDPAIVKLRSLSDAEGAPAAIKWLHEIAAMRPCMLWRRVVITKVLRDTFEEFPRRRKYFWIPAVQRVGGQWIGPITEMGGIQELVIPTPSLRAEETVELGNVTVDESVIALVAEGKPELFTPYCANSQQWCRGRAGPSNEAGTAAFHKKVQPYAKGQRQ